MHIPDNYLSPETCLIMGGAMVPVVAVSIRRVRVKMTRERLPLIGVGAALSFLMMMFNVPIPGGTTAHAVGGTLLAILLGPEAACLAIAAALLIQCLVFGDGGILAYGVNLFNMAFIMPFAGYAIYRFLVTRLAFRNAELIYAGIASYLAINIAALIAAIEFGIQPLLFTDAKGLPLYSPYPLKVSIPAMLIPHLTLAGLAEIVFTVGVLIFIKKVSPEILQNRPVSFHKISALLLLLIPLTPLGLFSAASAWGEWSNGELHQSLGYLPKGMAHGFNYQALLSGYSFKGMPGAVGYILSAVAGVALLVIFFRIFRMSRRKDEQH